MQLVCCKTVLTALEPERRVAVQSSLTNIAIEASVFDNKYHVTKMYKTLLRHCWERLRYRDVIYILSQIISLLLKAITSRGKGNGQVYVLHI